MKSRLNLPQPDTMSPEQRAIYDDVLTTRGNASGPFLAWLLSPGLADPAQQLGAFCRYNSSLALRESELLILLVAAQYSCRGEQQIHEPIALKAGMSEAEVAALRQGELPAMQTPRLQLLGECAHHLLRHKRLSPALYDRAVQALSEKTVVEVVGIVGYYALVAYTLNAFEMEP